ncbi:MAG: hypothetical protein JWL69_4105 [Phycisphaerales bacterium]|jgi:hypothetical protein|nr:hypothetical protein [Phycisphaerales bacterium]MDB5356478.1 hypothetical protein [Phycisphaerales bacterium]
MAKTPKVTTVTPSFKWVFISVLLLTLISLGAAIALSFVRSPTNAQTQLIETCSTCWKMGFGAIVGLIGGKAT